MAERKIVIIEDDSDAAQSVIDAIGFINIPNVTISVVRVFTTKTDARQYIEDGLMQSNGVTHVLVDGNLTSTDMSDSDGNELIALIKKQAPSVKTIDYSSGGNLRKADYPMSKFGVFDYSRGLESILRK